jgi:hypothetical protein
MRSAIASAALGVVALTAAACESEAPERAPPGALVEEFGLTPVAVADTVATLAWQPASCPQAYRVQIAESYPPGLEDMLRTRAEHSESWLVVAGSDKGGEVWPAGPVPEDRVFVGRSLFRGPKTQNKPLQREFALSATLAGPASPDAPCYERTWDPVEDALALGWPALPGRMVAVGETWRGARVEARCNRSACVDPQTRGGGPDNHHRPCTTMSWRERLDGIFQLGDGRVAEISSFWSDGQPLDQGIWSERKAIVSLEHGRLIHSETLIHHGYSGIEREVRIDAVDECAGGLVAAGWSPDRIVERDELLAELTKKSGRDKTTGQGR